MRPRLEVTLAREGVVARVRRGRRVLWSGECPPTDAEQLAKVLVALRHREDFPKQCQEVRFQLEAPFVQLRTLRGLPPVRGAELGRMVEQQAARFFRRRQKTLIVDARWQDRKNGMAYAGAIDAKLVDMLCGAAAALNMMLVEVMAAPNGIKDSRALRFVTTSRRRSRMVRIAIGAAVVSAWLCGSYVAGYVLDLEIDRRRFVREVESLQPELAVMETARREIVNVVSVVGALEAREARRGWVTRLLARLADVLPESAHLVSVSGTPGSVVIGLRALDVDSVVDSLVRDGLPIVLDGVEDPADVAAEGEEWQAATVRLNGGLRAGS